MRTIAAAMVAAALAAAPVLGGEEDHTYSKGDTVTLFANKMGPFHNPLETYAYFELPGCRPAAEDHKFPSLGQALAGDELFPMNIAVKFAQDSEEQQQCAFTPDAKAAERWASMAAEQYWYQLNVDGLPVWASFGLVADPARLDRYGNIGPLPQPPADGAKPPAAVPMVYTHQALEFGYNGDHIVFANLTAGALKPVRAGEEVRFTYSVRFTPSRIRFEDRFRRYLDNNFFEHRIHWISLFNSFMLVVLLAAAVLVILSRTLRADIARADALAAERAAEAAALGVGGSEWVDESGWKQLHGDVFRVPPHAGKLAALVGVGCQLVVLGFGTIVCALGAMVYANPGTLLTYGVVLYALTSFVAGYVSGRQYVWYTALAPTLSRGWVYTMLLTAGAFSGLMMVGGFLLNIVAVAYDSAQAIAFGAMVVMALLWLLVAAPLVAAGTIAARNRAGARSGVVTRASAAAAGAPLPRVHQIPRMVPEQPCYLQPPVMAVLGGLLPFGCIFIELYFVFTSFWNYKLYYVYGFLMLVFAMMLVVTAAVAVVVAYLMLNHEEHRWQWRAFATGASVSGYVFLYAVYFFLARTAMRGFFMFVFYFSYMALLCIAIGLMAGAVAFTAARLFVERIFRDVKAD